MNMSKLIRIVLVFCLLIGAVFLGAKIYKDFAEMDVDQARRRVLLIREMARVKKEAKEKKSAIEKAYRKARADLDKVGVNQEREHPRKGLERVANPGQTKKAIPQGSPPFDPLDEEDSILTSELLGQRAVEKNNSGESVQGTEGENRRGRKPIDLDQVSRIRDLYSKTIEMLDWN